MPTHAEVIACGDGFSLVLEVRDELTVSSGDVGQSCASVDDLVREAERKLRFQDWGSDPVYFQGAPHTSLDTLINAVRANGFAPTR